MKFKFSVHPLFVIFLILFLAMGLFDVLLAYILTLFIHEYAHFVVASKRGYSLNKFRLMPHGISLSGQNVLFSYKDEIIIALAGPMINLFISVVFFAVWWIFPEAYVYTSLFVFANLVTGLLNFLPVFPMDGGRILLAILSKNKSRTGAFKIVKIVGICVSFLLVILFFVSTFFYVNYTFLTLGLFCFFTTIFEDKNIIYERAHFLDNKNFSLKKGLVVREIAVTEDTTLYRLVREIRQDSLTNFRVLNKKLTTIGIIEEKQIENLIKVYPATATLKMILS